MEANELIILQRFIDDVEGLLEENPAASHSYAFYRRTETGLDIYTHYSDEEADRIIPGMRLGEIYRRDFGQERLVSSIGTSVAAIMKEKLPVRYHTCSKCGQKVPDTDQFGLQTTAGQLLRRC